MTTARFGLSTHLFHGTRLGRPHLEQAVRAGFDLVEVFATRTHVAYDDTAAVIDLRRQLDVVGLEAWSLHAPICDGFADGIWGRPYSNATSRARERAEAVAETRLSIEAARLLGCRAVVLHLGMPTGQPIPAGDNDRGALAESLGPIAEACATAGVRLALEVIPNDLATPDALVGWLSGEAELGSAGVCLDVGHAHLVGGAPEAIETLAGYIITTHLHDNRGRSDDHLIPFDGTIDWHATLMAFSKVGYDGPLIFELPDHGNAARVLERLQDTRRRIRTILDDLNQPIAFGEG